MCQRFASLWIRLPMSYVVPCNDKKISMVQTCENVEKWHTNRRILACHLAVPSIPSCRRWSEGFVPSLRNDGLWNSHFSPPMTVSAFYWPNIWLLDVFGMFPVCNLSIRSNHIDITIVKLIEIIFLQLIACVLISYSLLLVWFSSNKTHPFLCSKVASKGDKTAMGCPSCGILALRYSASQHELSHSDGLRLIWRHYASPSRNLNSEAGKALNK